MSKKNMQNPAIFLDRDGTINVDSGYLREPAAVELIPGAAQAIREWNESGFPVIVISNQSGVARGMMSLATMVAVHQAILQLLAKEGAFINASYFCPHHKAGAIPLFSRSCDCRKPGTALISRAIRQHHLDAGQSVMIGDKYSDIAAGNAAGMRTILVKTGNGAAQSRLWRADSSVSQPDAIVEDLSEAAAWWRLNR